MKSKMKLLPILFLFLLVSVAETSLFKKRDLSLFSSDDVLEVTLKGNFFSNEKEFKALKFRKEKKYVQGTLIYKTNNQESSLPLNYKVRGVYRQENCELPPLKLNFKKKILIRGNLFSKAHDKIKLVTHCENYSGEFSPKNRINQKVVSEYINYKLLSKIYPYSFKARLLKVSYEDNKFGPATFGYGIFLENKKDMVKRLDLSLFDGTKKEFKKDYYKEKESFSISNYVYLTLAQSIANNWDWYPTHNTLLVKDENNQDILVPYDFDLTGIVYDVIDHDLKEKGETHKFWHRRERRHFDFRAFPYQKSINYIRDRYNHRYDFSDEEIIKLFLNSAKKIVSKKDEVFKELDKYKHLTTANNFKIITARIANYFSQLEVALYNKVNLKFFTEEDYLKNLHDESFEKRHQAIIALGYLAKEEYFEKITSNFYKLENYVLKRSVIHVLSDFSPEVILPFLKKILGSETKTSNLNIILDVVIRFPDNKIRKELIIKALFINKIYSNKALLKKILKAVPENFNSSDKKIRAKLKDLKTLVKGKKKIQSRIDRTLKKLNKRDK